MEDLGLEVSEKAFRLKNKKFHLKYDNHLDPVKWLKWCNIEIGSVKLYSIVSETGKTGYQHTHILIELHQILQSRSSRIFDYEYIHPNIKKIASELHWNNSVKYHYKQGNPYTNINKEVKEECKKCLKIKHAKKHTCGMIEYEEVKEEKGIEHYHKYSSISEAIQGEHQKNVKGIHTTITAMKYKPINYGPEPKVEWFPWQGKLLNEVREECDDDRTIIWIWKGIGNMGKTAFAKHLAMWHGAFIATHANSYHIATTLQNRFAQGSPANLVIFNLVRDQCDHKIYQGLEQIKDGLITSQKNNGETLIFNSPHIVVFANFPPDKSKLSEDRWDIRELNDDGMDFKIDPLVESLKKPKLKPALKEGFSRPGRIPRVAKPDPIRTREEIEEEDENECDGNSSVSSPGRRSLSECSFENERPLIQNRVDDLLKICGKNDLPKLK